MAGGERSSAKGEDTNCEVRALEPGVLTEDAKPTRVWGQAQYRCSRGGALTVGLDREQRWMGWVTAATQTHDAPASIEWSEIFRTSESGCRTVRFKTWAKHEHGEEPGGSDTGGMVRPCS